MGIKNAVSASIVMLLAFSTSAMAADKYQLRPDTPKYVCDELLLGAQHGKPLNPATLSFFEKLVGVRYDIKANGLEEVLAKGKDGILFLPNHDGPNGPVVMLAALARDTQIRPVMTEEMVKGALGPVLRYMIGGVNGLLLPNPTAGGKTGAALAQSVINEVGNALHNGDNVLLYGSGTVQSSKEELLHNNSAVETLVKANPNMRIVLVRERGLWGSQFSHGAESSDPSKKLKTGQLLMRGLLKGAMMFAGNGVIMTPKRPVRLEFFEPKDFPRHGTREEMNRYMEAFYNSSEDPEKRVFVREYFWQFWKKKIRISEEEIDYNKAIKGHSQVVEIELPEIDSDIAEKLIKIAKSVFPGSEVTLDTQLDKEVGLDSLNTIELISSISEAFDLKLADDVEFSTLRDLGLMIAKAAKQGQSEESDVKISEAWKKNPSSESVVRPLEGTFIPEMVVKKALASPSTVIAEDQNSGPITYKSLVTKALAVSSVLKNQKGIGEHLGVLLPAAAGGTLIHLATQLSGKVPVYVNFTAAPDAIIASLDSVGVKKILTSRQVYTTLSKIYDMSKYRERFIFLDDLKLSIMTALPKAIVRYELGRRVNLDYILKDARKTKFAVILFTSGSSGSPKAVGLTHQNILTNASDVNSILSFRENDRLLNFLPPFHSFGHMVNALSQVLGVPSVYHAKPTDAQTLAHLIEAYNTTIVAGTPSFMEAIALKAGDKKLPSVRLIFTGAEALKEAQIELFKKVFPNAAVVEGYGTTELSPVVAVNPPGRTKLNSVGQIMPSLHYRIVGTDDLKPVKRGEAGLLMVRGGSVFPGYLNTENKDTFVKLEDGELYYNTGDVVREDDDKFIFILGRLGRFRKVKGEMISLPAIEKSLGTISEPLRPKNSDGSAFAGPLIAVESAGDNMPLVLFSVVDLSLETVQKFMRDNGFGGAYTISEVRRIKEIPMLGTGKADYKVLQAELKK